jgi:hypothetical protein
LFIYIYLILKHVQSFLWCKYYVALSLSLIVNPCFLIAVNFPPFIFRSDKVASRQRRRRRDLKRVVQNEN